MTSVRSETLEKAIKNELSLKFVQKNVTLSSYYP